MGSQRTEKKHKVLPLRLLQVGRRIGACAYPPEVVDHTSSLSGMRSDRLHDVARPAIMQEEHTLTNSPQRCRTELGPQCGALHDVIPSADVVHQQVREQIDGLESQCGVEMVSGEH